MTDVLIMVLNFGIFSISAIIVRDINRMNKFITGIEKRRKLHNISFVIMITM